MNGNEKALLLKIRADVVNALLLVDEMLQAITPGPPDIVIPAVPSPGLSPLTRLVAPDGGPLSHAYSTKPPWNRGNTAMVLEHGGGQIGLHDGKGTFNGYLPGVRADSRVTWSADPNVFFMRTGNKLQAFDIGKSWGTQPTTVHEFTEFQSVDIGGGEGDLSDDGLYLPMIGDGNKAFLFQLSTNSIVSAPLFLPVLNACYVSPDNHLIVTGAFGVKILSRNALKEVVPNFGHMDTGRDTDGSEIIVWSNNNDNAVTKVRLSDGQRTPLITFDWKIAVHVCLPQGKPYAVVSCFAPGGEDVLYADAILKVPFDGSAARILAHHKSDTTTGDDNQRYSGQPHAVASGNQFLFDSREDGKNVVYLGTL